MTRVPTDVLHAKVINTLTLDILDGRVRTPTVSPVRTLSRRRRVGAHCVRYP